MPTRNHFSPIEEPCGRNGFACSSGSPRCINKEFKYCNGYGDCSDNSDEMCTSGPQSDDGIGVGKHPSIS